MMVSFQLLFVSCCCCVYTPLSSRSAIAEDDDNDTTVRTKQTAKWKFIFLDYFQIKKKGWESKPIKLHTDILILFLWFLSLHSHLPLNEQPQKSWREAWRIEKNRPHCQPDEITINRHWLWAFFFRKKYWTLCINTHSIEQSNSTSQNNCGEQSMAWLDEK